MTVVLLETSRLPESNRLKKAKIDELTKKWFEIKDDTTMSTVQKRAAYDQLYDEATTWVFGDLGGHAEAIRDYMHKAWLELGFEAGDGNNKAVNLAYDLIRRTSVPTKEMVQTALENYSSLSNSLDASDDFVDEFKNVIVSRQDLWKSYSKGDIVKIIRAAYKLLSDAGDAKQRQAQLDRFKKLENLRDLLSDVEYKDEADSLKVSEKSSEQEIVDVMRKAGFNFKSVDLLNKLEKILQQAKRSA